MLFVHNRMVVGMMSVAFGCIVLLGASCSRGTGPVLKGTASRNAGSSAGDSGERADVLPTRWTTYQNGSMGVTIPYPEGWTVEERQQPQPFIEFSEHPAPSDSESFARVHLTSVGRSLASELATFPNLISQVGDSRSGIPMTRVTYLADADVPNERSVAYLWEKDGRVLEIFGADGDVVLEYTVDHMGVAP